MLQLIQNLVIVYLYIVLGYCLFSQRTFINSYKFLIFKFDFHTSVFSKNLPNLKIRLITLIKFSLEITNKYSAYSKEYVTARATLREIERKRMGFLDFANFKFGISGKFWRYIFTRTDSFQIFCKDLFSEVKTIGISMFRKKFTVSVNYFLTKNIP